jgi:sulfatase maturation enzyme AslB (radical SAM superfamily)
MNNLNDVSNIFCTRPFEHVYGEGNGIWKLCCRSQDTFFKKFKFENYSVDKWFYSKFLDNLRKDLILGNKSKVINFSCKHCFDLENINAISDRQFRNNFNNNDDNFKSALEEFKNNGYNWKEALLKVKPKIFDIKIRMLGNYCNLSCFACKPSNSSTKIEELISYDALNYFSNINGYKANKDVILSLNKLLPYTKQIFFNGGEPFLTKDHTTILKDILYKKLNNQISIQYSTNLTKLDNETLNLLENFNVKFNISLDAYGKDNDYIRYKSNWDEIYKNIIKLKKIKCDKEICVTTSIVNVFNIAKYYNMFLKDNEFKNFHIDFDNSLVVNPDWLSIKNMPRILKIKAVEKLEGEKKFNNIIKMLSADYTFDDNKWKKAINYIKLLDKQRNTNILKITPELATYLT